MNPISVTAIQKLYNVLNEFENGAMQIYRDNNCMSLLIIKPYCIRINMCTLYAPEKTLYKISSIHDLVNNKFINYEEFVKIIKNVSH